MDMESYLVLTVAEERQLPCLTVRVIMDEAASDLPDFNAGLDTAGRVKLAPTLRALVARPRATASFLLALQPALRSLEQAARVVLRHSNLP